MYKHKDTADTLLKYMSIEKNSVDETLFTMRALVVIDLRDVVEMFTKDCNAIFEGTTNEVDIDEAFKFIMPYIRFVTYDFLNKEVVADNERCAFGLLYSDIIDQFRDLPDGRSSMLAEAHHKFATHLVDTFVMIGLMGEEGLIPYSFVKKLTTDAYLFATPLSEIYTGLDDKDSNPLCGDALPIRVYNPKRYNDVSRLMALQMVKDRVGDNPELVEKVLKIFEEGNTNKE